MADLSSSQWSSRTAEPVVVLSVSHLEETQSRLRGIFEQTNWKLRQLGCCHDALDLLRREPVGVVLYEEELPGSSWKSFLGELEHIPESPLLIVASRQADERKWAEVLNMGGYDMLAKPFDPAEVTRVISIAWLHWRHRRKPLQRAAAASDPLLASAQA